MSRALRQLRAAFDDPLIASPGRNARLTDRAEMLRVPLANALAGLDQLLRPVTPFDPARESARMVVNTADYVIHLFGPILCELCAREAPHVVLEFTVMMIHTPEDLAKIDFLLGPMTLGRSLGKRVGHQPLWQDELVCISSAGNIDVPARITVEEFQARRYASFRRSLRTPHEMSALVQPTSPIESDPVCIVPSFLALGGIVAQSDCLALVPRRVADQLLRWVPIRIVELDYPKKRIDISAFWSPASEVRRGRTWFAGLLARAAHQMTAD